MNTYTVEYLELSVIAMFISLFFTLLIFSMIFALIYFLRRNRSNHARKLEDLKSLDETGPLYINHYNDKKYEFDDNIPCELQYMIFHETLDDVQLTVKIKGLTVGGLNNSVEADVDEFNQVYFQAMLNNNNVNSIIISEKYDFSSRLKIDETFIFQMPPHELSSTCVVLEVLANFRDNDGVYLIGWIVITGTDFSDNWKIERRRSLCIPQRIIDLFFNPVCYVCISLVSTMDKIKMGILATSCLDLGSEMEDLGNVTIHFSIKLMNKKYLISESQNYLVSRQFSTTILWNEVFLFNVPNEFKADQVIKLYLWKTNDPVSMLNEQSQKIGSLKLGLGYFPQKSIDHWNFILENENEENTKWHPIQMYGE